MKLGKKKFVFIKVLFILLFMAVVSISTISYLYYTNNISSSDYLKIVLSDSYENNFYNNLVEFVSNNLNPLKFIEFNNNEYKSFSSIEVDNPIIYIYNSDQSLNYKTEYNFKPNVSLAAYYLSEELNKLKIDTIFEDINISGDMNLFVSDKLNDYSSIKYVIDLGRSTSSNDNIRIDGIDYSNISLYTNKSNMKFITKLHTILNKNYKGISKIYFNNTYDDIIKIDIGGYNSNMSSVLKSIKALSSSIGEVINE